MSRLERELVALPDLNATGLRARWLELDECPPPNVPAWLLRSLLASRMQERRFGPLPAAVRKELGRLASGAGLSGYAVRQKIGPGARLVREWNGRTVVVEVIEEGYRYDERTWRSLSEIARHVTGTHWSGPRFFGLAPHG